MSNAVLVGADWGGGPAALGISQLGIPGIHGAEVSLVPGAVVACEIGPAGISAVHIAPPDLFYSIGGFCYFVIHSAVAASLHVVR